MAFFRKRDVSLPLPEVQRLAQYYGLDVHQDRNGNVVLAPKHMPESDLGSFLQYWNETGYVSGQKRAAQRRQRYESYRFMDENCGECATVLDTYASEAAYVGSLAERPMSVELPQKYAPQLRKILREAGMMLPDSDSEFAYLGHVRVLRSLAKYGDVFFEVTGTDELRVRRILDPLDVTVEQINGVVTGYTLKRQPKMPWEVVQFSISDDEFFPYGRSVLEALRSPYQRVLVTEALLAMSRASRVERLVVRVPVPDADPTAAFGALNALKNRIKGMLFGQGQSLRTKSKLAALTDVLFIPSNKDYSIDRLPSSVDISTVDDVEYFRDKLLMATRLPRGFLIVDSDTRYYGEGALVQQDLKFARALLPLQQAYAEGLVRLLMTLIYRMGGDLEQDAVKVTIYRPHALTRSVLEYLGDLIRTLNDIKDNMDQLSTINRQLTPEEWVELVHKMTNLPRDLLEIYAKMGEASSEPSPEEVAERILPQRIMVESADLLHVFDY